MKKYDVEAVVSLKNRIDEQMKLENSEKRDLHLSRKQINIIKDILPGAIEKKFGEWNGYGYTPLGQFLSVADFIKARNRLEALPLKDGAKKLTYEEKKLAWCKRLAKLSGIDIAQAMIIAEEKEEAKQEQIDELEERQCYHYSVMRSKLIRKIDRSNPLRPIKNREHAEAILKASERHNYTDYEVMLDIGREKAQSGEIDWSEVKDFARTNYTRT